MIRVIDLKTGLETQRDMTQEEIDSFKLSPEQIRKSRIQEIQSDLLTMDQKRIRPIAEGDTEYLAILNAQAIALREELRGLNA